MSTSYEGDPRVDDVAKVRWEIGDTRVGRFLLQDEEILFALFVEGNNILLSAARCAEHLAARFAQDDFIRFSTTQIRKSQISTHYIEIAKRLRSRSIRPGSFINLVADKTRADVLKEDSNITQPLFSLGMHNNNLE